MTWYRTGTITITANSNAVSGSGTNFIDAASGVNAGDCLIIGVGSQLRMYEIYSVNSPTSLTLATVAEVSANNSAYQIQTSVAMSNNGLAKKLSAVLDRIWAQISNWQAILSTNGNVTITAPDGTTVSGSGFPKLTTDLASKPNSSEVLLKASGGTVSGPVIFNGGTYINVAGGFSFRGGFQGGLGRNNDIELVSPDASAVSGSFVGALLYKWFSDGWLTGIRRGGGLNSIGYEIYYNGASTGGAGRSWTFNTDGSAYGAGAWINGSDIRHKSNLEPVKNPLAAVCSWNGCTYEIKDGGEGVGLIAQDVEKWCPTAIKTLGDRTFSDGTVVKDFKYLDATGATSAYHTEAIKELLQLIELSLDDPAACKAKIEEIKKLII